MRCPPFLSVPRSILWRKYSSTALVAISPPVTALEVAHTTTMVATMKVQEAEEAEDPTTDSVRSAAVYGNNMDIDNRLYMVKYDFEDNKEKKGNSNHRSDSMDWMGSKCKCSLYKCWGIYNFNLRGNLCIYRANLPPLSSSSLFQPKLIPSKSYPPFKNEGLSKASTNQRKSCKTHCLSTSCDHHLDEKFIGICPKCLYERLAIPKQKPSSFVSNAPTSSIVIVAHKPIFQPFATKHI
ncbi:hypothetical protein JHK82_051041 [Glycine max]|nr:hypothetical protein JHK82_051041 [Glycine max]